MILYCPTYHAGYSIVSLTDGIQLHANLTIMMLTLWIFSQTEFCFTPRVLCAVIICVWLCNKDLELTMI